RKRAEERLAQAEKLELIGRMTGGLAHDFNNLMGMVLGGLGLLAKRLPDDEKARRHFAIAEQAARRATEVTKSLLAVARKQPLEPRVVGVRGAIAEMLPLLRQSAGNAIEVVETHCAACTADEGRCSRALVDPAGLANAVLNLVINAKDAMPDGGEIRIDTESRDLAAGAAGLPPELPAGRYVVASVADTGTGMPPAVAARAFEPFFTTKEVGKGTGLGLAMVYGFARQSGGTATIDSRPGSGTTIRIYLPAADPAPEC
ncbi:MAG: ATP-binding protein, partial [Rhodocyclaceae bacterium]|nr:ATP-binding protein [Rhodocyclaceae bacterium]